MFQGGYHAGHQRTVHSGADQCAPGRAPRHGYPDGRPAGARSSRFHAAAVRGCEEDLQDRDGQVFLFPSSGTGGWEAAITNTLSPGDKVLVARFGQFSHLWIDMCVRHGFEVDVVDVPWGEGVPVEIFADRLKADHSPSYKAVLVTHNETATGVTSDVAAVRKALDDAGHPALLFVDGVSSIASIDFRMEEWGVDVASRVRRRAS